MTILRGTNSHSAQQLLRYLLFTCFLLVYLISSGADLYSNSIYLNWTHFKMISGIYVVIWNAVFKYKFVPCKSQVGNNINQYSWRRTHNWPSLISYQTSCVHCLRFFLSLIFWTRVAVLTLSDLCLLISTYRNTKV